MITMPNKYTGEPVAVPHSTVFKRLLGLQMKYAERDQKFEEFIRKVIKVKE